MLRSTPSRIAALLILTGILVACDPTLPTPPTAPTPTSTVTVPAAWYVTRPAEGCAQTWTDPNDPSRHTTFDGTDWANWVSSLSAATDIADTTIVFPTGCYYLGSAVYLDNPKPFHNVVVDGSSGGAWIVQSWLPITTNRDAIFELTNEATDTAAVQWFRMTGSAPADVSTMPYPARSDQDVGLTATGGKNITFTHNEISQTWSDPIYIADVAGAHIEANTVYRSGRNGIAVANGSDVRVTGNSVSMVALIGIDLEPNPPINLPLERVRVDHNTISWVDDSAYRSDRGNGAMVNITAFAPVYDVTIDNNTSDQSRLNFVLQGTQPIERVLIKDNSTSAEYRGQITVQVGQSVTVVGNTVTSPDVVPTVKTVWSAGTCGSATNNLGIYPGGQVAFQNVGGPAAC